MTTTSATGTIRVRFAPSPTGYLHVGGARTALFDWLFARKHKGIFILRIEDTDVARSTEDMSRGILEAMTWLGLTWDEGPYYQSQRLELYRETAERLVRGGYAYHDEGAIRFKVPEGRVTYEDAVFGEISVENQTIENFVLLRSDKHPTCASVGGHVNGESLSLAKYDPFWAKCEELGVPVFMHPGGADNVLKENAWQGTKGDLGNIIGNPLETTIFLTRLIFDGTLDKFPNLKVVAAHGGGYLPSYMGRTEVACQVRNNANCANNKKPSTYFSDQIFVDAMVFSPEGVRHLVEEVGASQVVYGTDIPLLWPDAVDNILAAKISDDQKEMILGGNLTKLLKL